MPPMHALLDDAEADPVDQLHALVDFEVGFFREHPQFGRLYLRYSSATMLSADREIDVVMRTRYHEAMRLQAALIERGQAAGRFRDGDPEVLARLFSGLVSAYQAMDPAVISDDPGAGERLPLAELHDIVAATFVVDGDGGDGDRAGRRQDGDGRRRAPAGRIGAEGRKPR
jgi:TetR/AcrR family transcriptional regulator